MGTEKLRNLKYYVALDNYEPARSVHYGVAEVYRHLDGGEVIRVPVAQDVFKDAERSLYLLDDGSCVVPYYVAGWNPTTDRGAIFLRAMPREDNGRVVDFDTWRLGPRRAYHLKIKKV